jgi:hypothetical protein
MFHVEVGPVLEELRSWLQSNPRGMRAELADVVVRAFAPAIAATLLAQPWQVGPEGTPRAIKGRPREVTGAWAAGVLVEEYLQSELAVAAPAPPPALALRIARDLVSALIGRPVAANQYYAARSGMRGPKTAALLSAITGAYSSLMETEGHRNLKPAPPRSERLAHAKWRATFKRLPHTLAVSGADDIAREALKSIPATAWGPLGTYPTKTTRRKATGSRRGLGASPRTPAVSKGVKNHRR